MLFGNDERKLNGHYAVYYVLSMEKGTKCWITVRVEVDANKPEYPSVTPRVPAAVWGEREVRDMYGLIPVGLPDERRLVLPDDWWMNFIRCVKTAWIIVSVRHRLPMLKPTSLSTNWATRKQRRADWSAARHF